MVKRKFWQALVEKAWMRRSIVWLSGVRRAGKTFLCRSLPGVEYFDCELPSVRRIMDNPETFLSDQRGKRIVLDEIHRLANPSEILKIAADHYPETRIIATGSSTLQASSRFRDTLTGRKEEIWLTPMIVEDLKDFENQDIKHRLLRGGLPPFFMSNQLPERDFQEWIDSYWARDIQELFRLEKRVSFQKLLELLFVNSGGIFEATRYTRPCEISRGTVANYLAVCENTWVAHVIRPFSKRRPTEIVAAPKVYAFDTGFVCCYRGWQTMRNDDLGILWEHFVLNEIMGCTQSRNIRYWRDKRGHETDFILTGRGRPPAAIECKWSADAFDPAGLLAFRRQHPDGPNWCVASDVARPFRKVLSGGIEVAFMGLRNLVEQVSNYGRSGMS